VPDIQNERTEAEHRWPAAIGVVAIALSYAALPDNLLGHWRYGILAICVSLLITDIAINPLRMNRQTTWSRRVGVTQAIVVVVVNQVILAQLIVELVDNSQDGPAILLASLQVWLTNVIGFALIFWELDRGGPVVRTHRPRNQIPPADFLFPQDQDDDAAPEVATLSSKKSNWLPGFVDYLYFSLSNSMAFSPTDVMPLTHRVKLMMGLEALAGFILLALVISRGVGLLG